MLLSEPQPTGWDLNFSLLGTRVRVHPFFWLMAVVIVYDVSRRNLGYMALNVLAVGLSILVHEFGHVLAFRWHGVHADIILHAFGGLAVPRGPGLWGRQELRFRGRNDQTPAARAIIAFAGPLAGFALASLVLAGLYAAGHELNFETLRIFGVPFPLWNPPLRPPVANSIVFTLLWVNIFWGLLNLLPIWPLDGGHISRAAFVAVVHDQHEGARRSLWLSIITIMAIGFLMLKFSSGGFSINLMLLASMLISNAQELRMYQGDWGSRW